MNVAGPEAQLTASATPPLVACEDLRVDVRGVPACDGLAFRSSGDHVLILGAPRALFDAITGVTPVTRGRLRVRDLEPGIAVRDRNVAAAPLDPPVPPRWSPREYVVWSARLAGLRADEAKRRADDALAKLSLGALAKTPLVRTSPPHARRAVVVAAALATGASILVLEDPLGGLPEEIAHSFARIVVTALEGKSWVVLAPRMPLTSPLAMHADEAIVVSATNVDAQGAPAEIAAAERRFRARVHGPIEAIAPTLAERGATVRIEGAHVFLDLGESLTTTELTALCASADIAVVELHPIARALS